MTRVTKGVGKGWHGEPGRHAMAARGIETARRPTRPKGITHRRAREWAFDVIYALAPHEIGYETATIDGREYLVVYEGWSEVCFLGIYDSSLPYEENRDRCIEFAAEESRKLLKDDWPRIWDEAFDFFAPGAREYKKVDGGYDVGSPGFEEFGMTWALYVRRGRK